MEWQPISTAPRDGTTVLAVVQGKHPTSAVPYVPVTAYWDEGWVTCEECDSAERDSDYAYTPTHWMPLPSPPKV